MCNSEIFFILAKYWPNNDLVLRSVLCVGYT